MKNILHSKNITYFAISIGIVLAAVLMRLLPHPANFAPIGALALFGGAHFKNHFGFIIPLFALFLSDIFLGFHNTIPYVYGSFLIIFLIGKLLKEKKTFLNIFAASIASSLLFFFVTNFGVWATSNMYAKDFSGLMTSYLMGIPFLRNTFLGDLFYTFSFFYGHQYVVIMAERLLLAPTRGPKQKSS